MTDETPGFSWTPSGSTNASSVGGALAIVIVSICTQRHWFDFDPVTAAALGVLCSAALGYLPKSGRLPK